MFVCLFVFLFFSPSKSVATEINQTQRVMNVLLQALPRLSLCHDQVFQQRGELLVFRQHRAMNLSDQNKQTNKQQRENFRKDPCVSQRVKREPTCKNTLMKVWTSSKFLFEISSALMKEMKDLSSKRSLSSDSDRISRSMAEGPISINRAIKFSSGFLKERKKKERNEGLVGVAKKKVG